MIQAATTLIRRYSHVHWALADQAMVSGANFLTGILLARYLGIEEFGRYTLAWMAILFVNSIQHAAINSPMMSIGPKQLEAEAPSYYGSVIVQQIVFSCTAFLFLWVGVRLSAAVFPEWRVEDLAIPLACAAFIFQLQEFIRRYFFTIGRGSAALASDAIRYLGQIVILVWLVMYSQHALDTAKMLWVSAIMAALATLFGGFFIERIPSFNASTLRATTSKHWQFSRWLTASALMNWMTGNLFIIAAGAMLGTMSVGALRAAQNLMGVVHILFMGLENIVPVRAAKYFHMGGKKTLCEYLKRVTIFGGGATATLSAILALSPEFWLSLAFGDQYLGYGNLLRGWAAIYLLIYLCLPLTAGLRAIEQPKIIFKSQIGVTLFSLLFAYPMAKYFGLAGVVSGIATITLIRVLTLWMGLRKRLI